MVQDRALVGVASDSVRIFVDVGHHRSRRSIARLYFRRFTSTTTAAAPSSTPTRHELAGLAGLSPALGRSPFPGIPTRPPDPLPVPTLSRALRVAPRHYVIGYADP
jgi:hypothetical protein